MLSKCDLHLFHQLVSCREVDGERGEEVEAVEAGHTLLNLTFAARDSQGPQSCARKKGDRSTEMDDDRNKFSTGRKENVPVHAVSK